MSANRPKGTSAIAEANKYEVLIHPRVTASRDNSLPIVGRAMFTDEPIKGKKKEAIVAMRSTALLLVLLSNGSFTSAIIAYLVSELGYPEQYY